MITTLQDIEDNYRDEINEKEILNTDAFISLSIILFEKIKIKGIADMNSYSDMLLFQYGFYDWGDKNGRCFEFDITRQFCDPVENEPYQLNFTLLFEPAAFSKIEPYSCWSDDFNSIENFSDYIKSTSGYKIACKTMAKKVRLIFGQC